MKKILLGLSLLWVLTACTPDSGGSSSEEASEGSNTNVEDITIENLEEVAAYGQGELVKGNDGKEYYKNTGTFYNTFDTIIQITLYTDTEEDFEKYFNLGKSEFERLHQLFDQYNAYEGVNNVYTINEMAGKEAVKVDEDLFNLIKMSMELRDETLGKTDIAMGSVLSLWHDAREEAGYVSNGEVVGGNGDQALDENGKPALPEGDIPSQEDLEAADQHTDPENIILDEQAMTVYISDSEMSIDVGATAKGYATELVAQTLKEEGLEHGLISAGGNIKAVGDKPLDNGNWTVGIQNPDISNADPIDVIEIGADQAVVTSGDYQRFFMHNGEKFHHIIDPEELRPITYYPSVTVVTQNSGIADMLSTAFFLSDEKETEEIIANMKESMPEIEIGIIWVDTDSSVHKTENLQ